MVTQVVQARRDLKWPGFYTFTLTPPPVEWWERELNVFDEDEDTPRDYRVLRTQCAHLRFLNNLERRMRVKRPTGTDGKMTVYSGMMPVSFAELGSVDRIMGRLAKEGYGWLSPSELFAVHAQYPEFYTQNVLVGTPLPGDGGEDSAGWLCITKNRSTFEPQVEILNSRNDQLLYGRFLLLPLSDQLPSGA